MPVPEYNKIEVSEKQLEDLIRQRPDLIEGGLKYIEDQRKTDRGPLDILMVDSGNALIVAELKIIEDDGMLMQAVDYYDFITTHLEGISLSHKKFNIDLKQDPRLFLIAPSFSVDLINRCKWIDIPISLFTFQCIELKDKKGEIIPVFGEVTIPTLPERIEIYSLENNLNYITDPDVRKLAQNFLDEIQSWDPDKVLIKPIKNAISLKVSGKVFSYFSPRRRQFRMDMYDDKEGEWNSCSVEKKGDLENARQIVRANFEKLK